MAEFFDDVLDGMKATAKRTLYSLLDREVNKRVVQELNHRELIKETLDCRTDSEKCLKKFIRRLDDKLKDMTKDEIGDAIREARKEILGDCVGPYYCEGDAIIRRFHTL